MSILTDVEVKFCNECLQDLPVENFGTYQDPRRKNRYLNSTCKACSTKRAKKYRQNLSPEIRNEREKWTRIWKSYRLRPEQYQEFIKDGCEVCGTHENLCVDHDHSCCPGKYTCGSCVRGVLCGRHNTAEGLLTTEEIINLLAYRQKFENQGEDK